MNWHRSHNYILYANTSWHCAHEYIYANTRWHLSAQAVKHIIQILSGICSHGYWLHTVLMRRLHPYKLILYPNTRWHLSTRVHTLCKYEVAFVHTSTYFMQIRGGICPHEYKHPCIYEVAFVHTSECKYSRTTCVQVNVDAHLFIRLETLMWYSNHANSQ
jgi:hypothetical protein